MNDTENNKVLEENIYDEICFRIILGDTEKAQKLLNKLNKLRGNRNILLESLICFRKEYYADSYNLAKQIEWYDKSYGKAQDIINYCKAAVKAQYDGVKNKDAVLCDYDERVDFIAKEAGCSFEEAELFAEKEHDYCNKNGLIAESGESEPQRYYIMDDDDCEAYIAKESGLDLILVQKLHKAAYDFSDICAELIP